MNKTTTAILIKYWEDNRCEFFQEIDFMLIDNNKQLNIRHFRDVIEIHETFIYWLENQPNSYNATAHNILCDWMEEYEKDTAYWIKGKESILDMYVKNLHKESICCKDKQNSHIKERDRFCTILTDQMSIEKFNFRANFSDPIKDSYMNFSKWTHDNKLETGCDIVLGTLIQLWIYNKEVQEMLLEKGE